MRQPSLSRSTVDRASDLRSDAAGLAAAWADGGLVLRLDESLAAAVTDRSQEREAAIVGRDRVVPARLARPCGAEDDQAGDRLGQGSGVEGGVSHDRALTRRLE